MRRVGIDVGGTNPDAVLVEDARVVDSVKTPTTDDVTGGVREALRLLAARTGGIGKLDAVMVGVLMSMEGLGAFIGALALSFFIRPPLYGRVFLGGAMLFQMRLNPAPPDPVQARIMQIMPIAFTAMFAFFPSGLVLYWLTNTVVSIAQQWRINQLVARES